MTQDTQAGAGAHPAPAQQPKTLRELAEVVRDWGKRDHAWAHPDPDCFDVALFGHISEDGEPYPVAEVNADTYGHEGVSLQLAQFYAAASPAAVLALLDRVELRDIELKAARADAKHWRSNHDNVVARLRVFTQRPDIPKELADRLPWHRELVRLQEVEAQALQQSADITDAEIDRIAESMPGSLDGFLKAWGWRQFARAILQAAPPAPAAVAVPDEQYQAQMAAISTAAIGYWKEGDAIHPDYDTVALRDVAKLYVKYSLLFNTLAAAPAQAHDDRAAFKAYLQECDDCEIVPDVAGAFHAAWQKRAAPAQAVAVPAEVELPDVEDMAHSAVQEALSYGVSHDVFHRWMRAVMDKTVQALAAAPAQEHATQLAGQGQTFAQWWDEQRKTAAERAPGDDWMDLSAEDRDQYEAVFHAGAKSAAPAQAQEDARDAARYRYWKQWWVHEESETAQLPKTVDQMLEDLDIDAAFDAAIDAARAAQGGA